MTPDTAPTGDQDRIVDTAAHCAACEAVAVTRSAVQHDCAVSGHLYDDDWPWPDQADLRALAPGSRTGDPCIWCDHDKGADE